MYQALLQVMVFLYLGLLGQVHGQNGTEVRTCLRKTCTERLSEGGLPGNLVYEALRKASPNTRRTDPTFGKSGNRRRNKRESYSEPPATSYEQPRRIIEIRRVIVDPPPGQPPIGAPAVGSPGGGLPPDTDPYIANMAPEDTVPIAIFPPVDGEQEFPSKCVVFSELTDFELMENELEEEAPPVVLSVLHTFIVNQSYRNF